MKKGMLALAVLSGILLVGAPACAKKEQRRDQKEKRHKEGHEKKKRAKSHDGNHDKKHHDRKRKAESEMNGVHQR